MRRVIFTESQINTILMSESAYPLDIKGDDGRPDNFTEYETVANNAYVGTGDDVNTDVTTSDQIKRCKKGWFGLHTTTNDYRLAEGDELDNAKTSGYGKKNDAFINSVSKNLGGKMVSNLSAEINSNKGGSRNNTNQVRASRMEKQKKEDPVTFQKNGGQKTLNVLKNQVKLKSTEHKAKTAGLPKKVSNTPDANHKPENHHGNSIYYFN